MPLVRVLMPRNKKFPRSPENPAAAFCFSHYCERHEEQNCFYTREAFFTLDSTINIGKFNFASHSLRTRVIMIVRSEGAAGGFFCCCRGEQRSIRADAAFALGRSERDFHSAFFENKTRTRRRPYVNCLNNIGPCSLYEGVCFARGILKETTV